MILYIFMYLQWYNLVYSLFIQGWDIYAMSNPYIDNLNAIAAKSLQSQKLQKIKSKLMSWMMF